MNATVRWRRSRNEKLSSENLAGRSGSALVIELMLIHVLTVDGNDGLPMVVHVPVFLDGRVFDRKAGCYCMIVLYGFAVHVWLTFLRNSTTFHHHCQNILVGGRV